MQGKSTPPLAEVNRRSDIYCLLIYCHFKMNERFFCKITAVNYLYFKCKKTNTVIPSVT